MKRWIIICAVMCLLAGCAPRTQYTDGTYFAAGTIDEESGYRTIVTITVKDGNISAVDWNELHYAKEDKKAQGDAYGMKVASAIGKEWYEQAQAVEQVIVKRGPDAVRYATEGADAGKPEGISGATISVSSFMSVFNRAMVDGPIPAGNYKNGIYRSLESGTDGYENSMTLVAVNGRLVFFYWDQVAADGAQGATLRLAEPGGAFDREAAGLADALLSGQKMPDAVAPAAQAQLQSLLKQAQ